MVGALNLDVYLNTDWFAEEQTARYSISFQSISIGGIIDVL